MTTDAAPHGHTVTGMVRRAGWASMVVAVACVMLPSCSTTTPAHGQSSTSVQANGTTSPASQLGEPAVASTTGSAENVLAASGIATVADESSTTPLVAVTGPIRMQFTTAQVSAMALQVRDGGGIRGSSLDTSWATTTGVTPFSYLLAAWVSSGTSPGARAMRTLMGAQVWSDAPTLLYPTIALPLFTADVIDALPAPRSSPATSSPSSTIVPSVYEPKGHELIVETAAVINAPCSLVSNFIQGVLNSVFNALQLAAPSGSAATARLGRFFVGIWNAAVALAGQVVTGLVNALTSTVVNAIETVAGVAAVIAEVVSDINPWTVKVTANPSSIDAGQSGAFNASVDSGPGGTSYPAAVTDCAQALNPPLNLPALDAAAASGVWSLSGGLTATSPTDITLDQQQATTISYSTPPPTQAAGDCGGTTPPGNGTATLTVTRPGSDSLKGLVNSMIGNGLGLANSIIGPTIQDILDPLLTQVLSALDGLTQVIGTGAVKITQRGAAECTPSPTATTTNTPIANGSGCIVGDWTTTGVSAKYVYGGAGMHFNFSADGAITIDYNGTVFKFTDGIGKPKIATGSSYGTYSLTDTSGASGLLRLDITSGAQGIGSTPGAWQCHGNVASFADDSNNVTYEMIRAGS
jgi:hypothetical protein